MKLRFFLICIVVLSSACVVFVAQAAAQTQPDQSDDVLRVDTALVQTDITVFDKKGSFVDGLKRDQFVLKVDGKAREITFFEGVRTGSRNEEAQLAAARGTASAIERPRNGDEPLDRGRTIYFLVDDLHLSPSSSILTRRLVLRFIDREMGQNDEVAVTSASGQIGFLEQLTHNKTVLRAAVDRLRGRNFVPGNLERAPMSEFQALKVAQNERDVVDYFVDQVLREIPRISRQAAAAMVQGRASQILRQADAFKINTLSALESLVRTSRYVPGRKILFFISDGFFLDSRNSDATDRIRQITSLAAASGLVIYSIDARGLSTGMDDASVDGGNDSTGRLQRGASPGEALGASQEPMHTLARDTGGRAFLNSNDLSAAVTTGLKETSNYYLLAWRPENEDQKSKKFRRIEVSVIGRDDLIVRFRRGFGEIKPEAVASKPRKSGQTEEKQSNNLLSQSFRAPYPKRELPVALTLNFVDNKTSGMMLSASLKVGTALMTLEAPPQGPPSASLDIVGAVYNDQGKSVSSYSKRVFIRSTSDQAPTPPKSLFYHHLANVKPGLYQVRVAALDVAQKRTGSDVQWIEIPDLSSKKLAMSSLIVGEKRASVETQQTAAESNDLEAGETLSRDVPLNVDHRFARSSTLRFLIYVYNVRSSGSASPPFDLTIQVKVFRDHQPVINAPPYKFTAETGTDPNRLAYAGDVPLQDLPPGQYVLQVTVNDGLAKTGVSQNYSFQIE